MNNQSLSEISNKTEYLTDNRIILSYVSMTAKPIKIPSAGLFLTHNGKQLF